MFKGLHIHILANSLIKYNKLKDIKSERKALMKKYNV